MKEHVCYPGHDDTPEVVPQERFALHKVALILSSRRHLAMILVDIYNQ